MGARVTIDTRAYQANVSNGVLLPKRYHMLGVVDDGVGSLL